MDNLRLVSVNIIDSVTIEAIFTHNLSKSITKNNFQLLSEAVYSSDSIVTDVAISNNTVTLTCSPLNEYTPYKFVAKSDVVKFTSINNDAILLEDEISNSYVIIGPTSPENPIRQFCESYLNGSLYDTSTSLINSYLESTTDLFSRALYDIRQAKNENYLSNFILDEQKTRGKGPFDRLNEEGCYFVSRIAKTPTGTKSVLTKDFTSFPSYHITFNETISSGVLTVSNTSDRGTFNVNELVLNLVDDNIIKLDSLTFSLSSAPYAVEYPIDQFGYQLLQNKYDPDHASKYYLESNQIKLSSNILDVIDINNILQISVSYRYSDLGINIDPTTLVFSTVLTKQREVIPALFNRFSFANVPIVDINGNAVTFGGVVFYNPNGFEQHPAFLSEIPYNVSNPPSLPGQYSIDYITGECFVYGAEQSDGTGDQPPLATYNYKHTFQSNIDYQYDVLASDIKSKNDLIALPDGALVNEKANYIVSFEKVLIKDVDYKEKTHIEVLNEYVDTNLVALNAIKTKNAPITNVFRIYNETSGEIYQINRWYKDKAYFNYINPPKLNEVIFERVSFNRVSNEELLVKDSLTVNGQNILRINLPNSKITAISEDGIGSFTNSSVEFTSSIFKEEVNYIVELTNIAENQYAIDYENGVVYLGITTYSALGKISYNTSDIKTIYPNIVSSEDIYYKINPKDSKQQSFKIRSSDAYIVPEALDSVNEKSYDDASYFISSKKIGYLNPTFVHQVKYNVKDVRGIYELVDYNQNPSPINFADSSTFESNRITANTRIINELSTVKQDGYGKYVDITFPIRILSSTLTYNTTAIGLSSTTDYFSSIEVGENTKIRLLGSAIVGSLINVIINITINDMSNVIVDYNKGDLYVDYTYLADNILISYEYGDNLIDFTSSNTVSENDTYYVSYYVGALRDALLTNFGQIINSPILNTFDTDLERERYRDAVIGALASFIKGPTIEAMKVLGFNISHIEPEVVESIFSNWILGSSFVTNRQLTAPSNPIFEQAKYGNGLLLGNEIIEMPTSSYIRTEEGTLSFWVKNKWDGISNDSPVTISILADSFPLPREYIFIGADSRHPETDQTFTVTSDILKGTPVKKVFGLYVYYDLDASQQFYRWYVEIVNDYTAFPTTNWDLNISSEKIYDFKELTSTNSKITTLNKSVKIKITTVATNRQYSFVAGTDKCLLSGDDKFTLIKDVSGYLNFAILDKFNNKYQIQSNVGSWKENDLHHIAMSWKLNNPNKQDEMHLFIDGKETSNIIKYGQQLSPYLHQKFQTINQEQIIAFVDKDIVGSIDLQTIANSNTVTSSVAFSSYNISNGDILSIIDIGDFVISNVLGNSLELTTTVPVTLNNAKFSVNKLNQQIASDWFINSRNIVLANTTILSGSDLSCLGTNIVTTGSSLNVVPGNVIKIDNNIYTILVVNGANLTLNATLTVFSNKDYYIYDVDNARELYGDKTIRKDYVITENYNNTYANYIDIYNNVLANDIVYIESLGLNNKLVSEKVYLWSDNHENILKTHLPTPINLDEVKITKHILSTLVNSSNSTVIGPTLTYTNSAVDQPSNSSSGRTLTIDLGQNNLDLSTPAVVSITGEVFGSPGLVTDTLTFTFTSTYNQDTIHKFTSISTIDGYFKTSNINKAITFNIKEKYELTYDEGSRYNYVIRHSHQIKQGDALSNIGTGSGNVWVEDLTTEFSDTVIGNVLIIQTTTNSGYYNILEISEDRHSIYVQPIQAIVTSFSNTKYLIVKVNNTGFANGWMYFEQKEIPGNPAFLRKGTYEIKYHSYVAIETSFDNIIFGNNKDKTKPANCVYDNIRSDFRMLSDVRSGEISIIDSITQEFNLINPSKANKYTLLLANLDTVPIEDKSNFYPRFINEQLLKTSLKVNENFDDSLLLNSSGISIDNNGNVNNLEGTVEFWVNPLTDTDFSYTDNYYFDAYSAVIEEVESNSSTSIVMNGNVGQVLSVTAFDNTDYFGNGYVETLPINSIKETVTSLNFNTVQVSSNILQIISIKVIDDLSGVNYSNGTIVNNTIYLEKSLPTNTSSVEVIYRPINTGVKATSQQIIRLGKRLPSQKQKVIVKYLPSGIYGDRISIFKDKQGYVNFKVIANNTSYNIKSQVFFERNTWHKIKASYKFNSSNDKMILFVDGYSTATYDSNSFDNTIVTPLYNTFYDGYVFGGVSYLNRNVSFNNYELSSSIKFKDPIHTITVGAEFDNTNIGNILLSNLRISNNYKELYKPYGEALDLSYNSNTLAAYPVTEDLYTTYLLDLKESTEKTDDFAILKTKEGGMFDFTLNIFDSFGIVSSSKKVKDILETLVKSLKPANSRVKINYKS